MTQEPSSATRDPVVDPGTLAAVAAEDHDGITVATIIGEIDMSNVDNVERDLRRLPNQALGLVLDLRGLRYLDSSGISLVHDLATRLAMRSQQMMIVCAPETLPRRLLTLTGIDGRVSVLDSLPEAIELARAGADEASD